MRWTLVYIYNQSRRFYVYVTQNDLAVCVEGDGVKGEVYLFIYYFRNFDSHDRCAQLKPGDCEFRLRIKSCFAQDES